VTWHQDLAIAVKERVDTPGFGPWSLKDGVAHAHAPAGVLQRMLAVRIHLDDADCTNGALRVIPGSHLAGKLTDAAMEKLVATGKQVMCTARAGDALVMRPLLLHASSRAVVPSRRRVVHIEYAIDELASPLQWFERIV
jgi:ectoine hydroxylase-related dioxygenase (phytanoyl-CoA dioxygenase family)